MSLRPTRWISALFVLTLLVSAPAAPAQPAGDLEWPTYGGDLASTRYSPADQITADNFADLELAWTLSTDNFGPEPEYNLQSTPLMVGGVLYTTAGTRRAVVAADAATGELLWTHRLDEGERGAAAPRRLSGRGLAYRDDGGAGEIFYVTPGYQLIGLDAATGRRLAHFGDDGVVDLKLTLDQDIDPVTGEVGLHAAPIVAGDTIVVGAAHLPGGRPRSMRNVKGHIRGFDAGTGERKWIFHTVPGADEFGNDTWLGDSWRYTGNTGVWGQMTVDAELGIAYFATEMPTNDYYGGHRHGDNLFSDSLVAVDLETGERLWHFQFIHHDVWDWDLPCAPILVDITVDGRENQGRRPAQQAGRGSTSSTGSPASRCGPSRSARSRRRTCPASCCRSPSRSPPGPPPTTGRGWAPTTSSTSPPSCGPRPSASSRTTAWARSSRRPRSRCPRGRGAP